MLRFVLLGLFCITCVFYLSETKLLALLSVGVTFPICDIVDELVLGGQAWQLPLVFCFQVE